MTDEERANVEMVLRNPSRTSFPSNTRGWTEEHIEYATPRVDEFSPRELRTLMREMLAELHASIIRRDTERMAASRHATLMAAIEKVAKPHWTRTWGFWVAVAAAIFAGIAAWPGVEAWMRSCGKTSVF